MVGEPALPTLTEKQSRGRKRGPDLSVLVETTVVGLFGLAAVATAHEHWLKEREDVMAITGPLNAWIDQLPSKTLKKVEKNLAPALFAVGCAVVIVPDVALEIRERAEQKRYRQALSQSPAGGFRPGFAPTEHAPGTTNGAAASSGSGWTAGIPTVGPIGSEHDL